MAVAARDGEPRLRQPQFRADHVDDPLPAIADIPQRHTELAAVAFERRDHVFGKHVEKRPLPLARRHDVIHGGEGAIRKSDAPAACAERVERLRTRDFVNQMQSDEQLRLPGGKRSDSVEFPDLLQECLSHFVAALEAEC